MSIEDILHEQKTAGAAAGKFKKIDPIVQWKLSRGDLGLIEEASVRSMAGSIYVEQVSTKFLTGQALVASD